MIIDRVDEEFLLFALRRDGRWGNGSVRYGIAGAWLAELLLEGRIRIDGRMVLPKGKYPVHDPALEAAFAPIRASRRPQRISTWVRRLSRRTNPHVDEVMARLRDRGYVEHVITRRLGRKVHRYPQHTPEGRKEMRALLVDTVAGRREPDEATLALLAVIDAAGFSGHVFGADKADEVHRRVIALVQRDLRLAHLADAVWGVQGMRFFVLDT